MKITMLESVGAPNIDRVAELFFPILCAWRERHCDTKIRSIFAQRRRELMKMNGQILK
jgi:hypothetical protein